MGMIEKVEQQPPPTSAALATDSISPAAADPEKATDALKIEDNLATQTTQGSHHHNVDPEAEKRVIRKLDRRVPVLVAALYLVSYLDRSNIGNAKIAGMTQDLDLTGNKYEWLLTIFYITYILFEWFALMWKVVPAHLWAAFTVMGWGIIATCQAATQTWSGMMACRFFLGAMEAGFGPGIPYLMSFFYLRHELGVRVGFFLSAAPLAQTFAGALAYGITSGHAHIANWRLLFLVEGIPSILMAFVAFFFLPDAPEKARFLTEEEKIIAKARGVRQVGEGERVGSIDFKHVGAALLDPKNWLTASAYAVQFMYFSCNVSFSSLPVFLPTIISEMGYSAVHAQGLTAPPYFIAFLMVILTTYIADRTQQRGLMIFTLSIIGAIGYVLLATCTTVGVRYFGTFLCCSGVFPAIGNILPWVLNNQGSDSKRGTGMVLLNLIGQCGPLLGTNVFPTSDGPRYIRGQWICGAFMFFNAFLALTLRTYLAWQNKQLDKKYGPPRRDTDPKAMIAEENEGPNFRNIL